MILKEITNISEKTLYEVSEKQKQTWYNQSLGNIVEILNFAILFQNFDAKAFQQGYTIMLSRHEILRAYFPKLTNKIKLKITPHGDNRLKLTEIQINDKYDLPQVKRAIEKKAYAELSDLETPPLIKNFLLKIDNKGTVEFVFFIHHIIADGWSIKILKDEFITLYNCLSQSLPNSLIPLQIQLKDFIHWQNINLRSGSADKKTDYWTKKLKDADQLINPDKLYEVYKRKKSKIIEPPYSKANLAHNDLKEILTKKFAGGSCSINLDHVTAVDQLSIDIKVGRFSILLASFYLLIRKCFEYKDVIFNCPVNTRQNHFTNNMVGDLTGSIYIRAYINKDMLLHDFIKLIYLEYLKSSRYVIYNHFRYENINKLNFHTNCTALINFYEMNESLGEELHSISRHFKHPCYFNQLSCSIIRYNDCFSFNWGYNLSLYKPEVIQFLVEEHMMVLHKMLNNPNDKISIFLKSQ